MKTEKTLVNINFVPDIGIIRRCFVLYRIGNLQIYDHRNKINSILREWDNDDIVEAFFQPALVQLVQKKGHSFINLFDVPKSEEPLIIEKLFSVIDGEFKIVKDHSYWRIINKTFVQEKNRKWTTAAVLTDRKHQLAIINDEGLLDIYG